MRWWGWGVDGHDAPLPSGGRGAAARRARRGRRARGAAGARGVELPAAGAGRGARARLEAAVVGAEQVRDDRLARVPHAAGRSYPDLVRLRAGRACRARRGRLPRRPRRGRRAARDCAQEALAVIPFGGGTSVVGGVEPLRGPSPPRHARPRAPHRPARVDARSQLATVRGRHDGPGRRAPLGARGLTLGHFPQSFEFSTVGGWVATRSAGQASTGYGRIDELVVALRAATPSGELATRPVPASAAGPGPARAAGRLGGRARRHHRGHAAGAPAPAEQRYDAWSLPGFAAGAEALRELEQAGAAPDVARLSDEEETRVSLALAVAPGRHPRRCAATCRARRGHGAACLPILGFDGDPRRSRAAAPARAAILRRHGAVALGAAPGAAWAKGRFHGAYLRDELHEPRRARRHARDRHDLDRPADLHRDVGTALRDALAGAARRRSSCATSRTSIPPARRCTSRSSRARRRAPSWSSGARRSAPPARRSAARRDDHPPPRRRHRPRAVARGRGRGAGDRRVARGQGARRPDGDHEPRQAAAAPTPPAIAYSSPCSDVHDADHLPALLRALRVRRSTRAPAGAAEVDVKPAVAHRAGRSTTRAACAGRACSRSRTTGRRPRRVRSFLKSQLKRKRTPAA